MTDTAHEARQAIIDRILAPRTSERKVPAAVTNIRKALGVTEVTHPREVAEKFLAEILAQGERDADVAEAKFGTADEIKSHGGVVTKLPEVHDPAGETLPFHVPSGKATQVMGTVSIDPSRMPDDMNPVLTDSKHRTLRVEHQVVRSEQVDTGVIEIDELIQASKFAKQAKAWGARVHVTVRVSR